jgi:hypothetical protein
MLAALEPKFGSRATKARSARDRMRLLLALKASNGSSDTHSLYTYLGPGHFKSTAGYLAVLAREGWVEKCGQIRREGQALIIWRLTEKGLKLACTASPNRSQ